jgi:hypothetical protein
MTPLLSSETDLEALLAIARLLLEQAEDDLASDTGAVTR